MRSGSCIRRIHANPTVLLDLKMYGYSFLNLFLQLCLQAEIYVRVYSLPDHTEFFDLSLPVTSKGTDSKNDMSSEWNDLGNIRVVMGILMTRVLQTHYTYRIPSFAAAILHSLLHVTSDNVGSMDKMFS